MNKLNLFGRNIGAAGPWAKTAVVAGFIALLYYSVLDKLVQDWINLPDFSHGFLIPLVSLYVVYDRRHLLAQLTPNGQWSGLAWVVAGMAVLLLGHLAMEYFTMRISLLLVIAGSVLFLLGKAYLKLLLFPIGYLVFMIPIPSFFLDRITFPMQLAASKVSAAMLQMIGIPVLRQGNVLELAHTSLEVAEACSGLRSLLSLLALAVVLAFFSQKTFSRKAVLVASTLPIAMVSNIVRVTGTGILANYFGIAAAQGFFHSFSGWVLYLVAFGCFLGLSYTLRR